MKKELLLNLLSEADFLSFTSIWFLAAFVAAAVLYYMLPSRAKKFFLLAASYAFYASVKKSYAVLILFSTLTTFFAAILIERIREKLSQNESDKRDLCAACKKCAAIFWLAILANVSLLALFKYFGFFKNFLPQKIAAKNILLPIGLSFYTFQVIGYLADVYKQKTSAEKNIFNYALFVSFFPKLVQGPIERSDGFLKQIKGGVKFDYEKIRRGLLTMLWGYFLKIVIADRAAVVANCVFNNYQKYSGFETIFGAVMYSLQIYADFYGYTQIARGAALVFGYELLPNFFQPYFATSVKDFWRRWHISLSSWLRDYIYIPLGGSRCSVLRKYFNLIATFFVSGIWHGSAKRFLYWGLIHAAAQIAEDLLLRPAKKLAEKFRVDINSASMNFFLATKNFIFITLTWILFRSKSAHDAMDFAKRCFKLKNIGQIFTGGLLKFGLNSFNLCMLFAGTALLVFHSVMVEKNIDTLKMLSKQNIAFRYICYWTLVVMIVFSLNNTGREFLYSQF